MKAQTTKLYLLLALLAPLACTPQSPKNGGTSSDGRGQASHYNDVARFLAGLPVENPSPQIKAILDTATYKHHVELMNGAWQSIEKTSLIPMRQWKKEQMPEECGDRLAFYPLSGADFGNFFTLLPDCREYLMIGLEDSGLAPEPFQLTEPELASGLNSMQRMVGQISIRNYFWTTSMTGETANRYLEGVTPAILVFMSRMGLFISNIEEVKLDEQGKVVVTKGVQRADRLKTLAGIRITFRAPNDDNDRVLQFLRIRIGPDAAGTTAPEGKFFGQYGDFVTMFKSAEYLMSFKMGLEFADFVLNRSIKIIQDDSGIPYAKFDSKWDIKHYGDYVRPYPLLQYNPPVQPDLAAAFAKERYPLPFPFGYGFYQGKGKSNMIIARKKK